MGEETFLVSMRWGYKATCQCEGSEPDNSVCSECGFIRRAAGVLNPGPLKRRHRPYVPREDRHEKRPRPV